MNIRAERLNRGLSIERAAAEIGISRGTLARAETGEMPQPRHAKAIADFFTCRVTDLWPVADPAEETV